MKRAAWYLAAGAVAGFAGVIGLHGKTAPAAQRAAGNASGRSQPGPSAPFRTVPAAGASPGGQGQPGPATAAGGPHSAAGAIEQFGYGELAVRVTATGDRITNVTVPALQTAEPFSRQLSEQAIPLLRSQVLAADGANINGVSGATFTSEAYATSVQAALDKLHLR